MFADANAELREKMSGFIGALIAQHEKSARKRLGIKNIHGQSKYWPSLNRYKFLKSNSIDKRRFQPHLTSRK